MIYFWTNAKKYQIQAMLGGVLPDSAYDVVPLSYQMLDAHEQKATVLAMGGKALQQLQLADLYPKNISITAANAVPSHRGALTILPTFDPSVLQFDVTKISLLRWAVRLAARIEETGTAEAETGEYVWVDSLEPFIDEVMAKHKATGRAAPVAWDLETMGLWPWFHQKQIVCSQWCHTPGQAVALYHYNTVLPHSVLDQLRWLMQSDYVRSWGSNLKYDLQWMSEKYQIICKNFSFDSTVAGSLLDENRFNSLNAHAKDYTTMGGYDDDFNKEVDKAHMELVEKPKLLQYGGGDSDASFRVSVAIQRELLNDPALLNLYKKILHPGLISFEKIERRGVLVDLPKYLALEKDLLEEIKTITRGMMRMIPMVIKAKHSDNLSLSRPDLLRDFLFTPMGLNLTPKVLTEKTEEPSTSIDDHLSMFRDHPEAGPFITEMEKLNSAKKTLSTYVVTRNKEGKPSKGFLTHLRPDGKFHPTYSLHAGGMFANEQTEGGTVTGRLSAKNPAMQTLPKHTKWAKRLRECYPAPPGYLCWQLDFSQGELRVAADIAKDETMIEVYNQGSDLHTSTGAMVAGVSLEEMQAWKGFPKESEELGKYKEFRSKAKPVNFGLLYAMQAPGFVEYARKSYGTIFTLQEATDVRDNFFNTYDKLLLWHDAAIAFAREHFHVRSPLGRIRHLPLIRSKDHQARSRSERQAINSPVQGCLSDLTVLMISEIDLWAESLGVEDLVHTVGSTHDSANGYVLEAQAEDLLTAIQEIGNGLSARSEEHPVSFLEEQFGWKHALPFPVDLEVGGTLATLDEVSFAA